MNSKDSEEIMTVQSYGCIQSVVDQLKHTMLYDDKLKLGKKKITVVIDYYDPAFFDVIVSDNTTANLFIEIIGKPPRLNISVNCPDGISRLIVILLATKFHIEKRVEEEKQAHLSLRREVEESIVERDNYEYISERYDLMKTFLDAKMSEKEAERIVEEINRRSREEEPA